MNFEEEFKNIRPYNDSEVKLAIERLIANRNFKNVSQFFGSIEELKKVKTIDEFQSKYSHDFVKKIISETSDGLTSSGIEGIRGKGHLFIANHRDIIFDSALLQLLLIGNGIPTTEITVGDNLMANTLFHDLGKLNKVFTLSRGGGKIQMYKNAILHSRYIHILIREKNESLWIAQRDGRTKDGNDKTQQGLLKMLLGDRKDFINAYKELAIVSVSTSYEYEPCFKSKVKEIYISLTSEYTKSENEDMQSSVGSMFAKKGRIHVAFGTPLNKFISEIEGKELSNIEIVDACVNQIDKEIYENFKLWPNNYIAWDIINNSSKYSENYTKEEKQNFEKYILESISEIDGDKNKIKEIAYGIYANPVSNKFKMK
jgi:hypothetical protein